MILLLLAAFAFTLWAQVNVKSTFSKYSSVYNSAGLTGAEAARRILDANGLYNIGIERIAGELTDHFDPQTGVIRLSDGVYDSPSAAAVGVAAHEAGHAVQHAVNYAPIRLRTAIIPVCNIGSKISWPLILLGLLLGLTDLAWIGVILFASMTAFQLVTLPCEFNASSRAIEALRAGGDLSQNDLDAAEKTLHAAALTYVAALAVSLINLLRVVMMVSGGRRRR